LTRASCGTRLVGSPNLGHGPPMSDDDEQLSGIELWEIVQAQGFRKKDGKHIATDGGLVSRGGYRRIMPNRDDGFWLESIKPDQLGDLERVARAVLTGRNATVFDGLVLAPLRSEPKREVKDLADQFGVRPARVYKILHKCIAKVKKRQAEIAAGGSIDGKPPHFEMMALLEAWENTDRCSLCGRQFVWELLPECNGIYGDDTTTRPECLEAHRRDMELRQRLAEARAKDRAWDEANKKSS
jgi:hypothetical protein